MNGEYLLGGVLSILLMLCLIYALLWPEKF